MSLPGLSLGDIIEKITFYHSQHQLAKYLAVVSITLLVYDWILNIDLEVAFIWQQSWTWGRVVYHANRIWSLVLLGTTLTVILFLPAPSPSVDVRSKVNTFCAVVNSPVICSCKQVGFLYSYGANFQYSIVSAMLLLRCWALYEKKQVVWMLCGGLIGVVVSGIVIAHFIIGSSSFIENPLPNIFSGCIMIVPDYVWVLYMMPLFYESTLFTLMIWRIYTLSKNIGATPLMQTLAKNGIAYFATLVILVILACIGSTIQVIKIGANGSGLFNAVSSVVCSHMIFSLYQTIDDEIQEAHTLSGTRGNPSSDTTPRFAIPLQSLASSGGITQP
ncbi:hypothetical protein OPQ81_002380 [Rhizoctonia solani]|nr:hypothetical protein OPQ81_002380 [Rhizoctonia solani]